MKIKIFLSIFSVLFYLSAFIFGGFDISLQTTEYNIISDLISEKVTICFISDFHSSDYGEELYIKISNSNPDIVLLGGDIFDETRSNTNAVNLITFLAKNYICYFVTGNHEYWCGEDMFDKYMQTIKNCGIIRLSGETAHIEINGQKINICGVDDPTNQLYEIEKSPEKEFENQLSAVSSEINNGNYTILLTHRPEYITKYTGKGFNLVLAGHAHGGQIRIPGIINGLYSPGQGYFPKYTFGEYFLNDTEMIVSRGLSTGKESIPRFYNKPEIVIINLLPE